jgi:predicted transcriptional regulator
MRTRVLLSIKPGFAFSILSGEKRYEFRRVIFRENSVCSVVIYASAPVSRVIGEFSLEKVLEATPRRIWSQTRCQAGITLEYFNEYFSGRTVAYALKVGEVTRYDQPKTLWEGLGVRRPPQSFCYL